MKRAHRRLLLVALAAVLVAGGGPGCKRTIAGGSTDGAAVFKAACAQCHGDTGKPPPQMTASLGVRDLTSAEFQGRRTRELIEHQVRKGSANGRMPAFTGAMSEAQIKAVVEFVMAIPPGQ